MLRSDETLPALLLGYVSALGLKQIYVVLAASSLLLTCEKKTAMSKSSVFILDFILNVS